jgi:hypothetical protein
MAKSATLRKPEKAVRAKRMTRDQRIDAAMRAALEFAAAQLKRDGLTLPVAERPAIPGVPSKRQKAAPKRTHG